MSILFGRSIGLKNSLKKGHLIHREDLIMRKPAGGYTYEEMDSIIGRVLNQDVDYKDILKPNFFADI